MEIESIAAPDGLETQLRPAVARLMSIEDVTIGGKDQEFAIRFRGRLVGDSRKAYTELQPEFDAAGMTLLFREDGARHVVLGLPGVIRTRPSNPWINLLLFVATLLSVLFAGVLYGYQGPVPEDQGELLLTLLRALPQGMPFAASLLAILLAHEFGHYLAARYHKTAVTLPYFLPFPGNLFGTLGAFIRMKEPPRDRRILLDIGLAGPLAGLAVAIPVLLLGLALSEVSTLPSSSGQAANLTLEGNSILYLAAKWLVKGELLPAPASYNGVPPSLYWLQYFFLGLPAPFGGRDVLLHPVAWAGWAGLLVTALNLMPVGQLDGGHLMYVLLGRAASRLWPFLIVGLLAFGLVWQGWWIWAALLFFLGRVHARPLDEITPLDPRRRSLAIFGLIIFLLTFTPIPLRSFLGF